MEVCWLVDWSVGGREGRQGSAVHHVNLAVARAVGAKARLHSQLMRCLSEKWEGSGILDSAPKTPSVSLCEETTRPQAFSLPNSIYFLCSDPHFCLFSSLLG